MDRVLLDITIPTILEKTAQLRKSLTEMLSVCAIKSPLKGDVQLCFSEAINNIIKHNPVARKIRLRFGRNSKHYWLELQDDGQPWNPSSYDSPPLASISWDAEYGRGLPLIHKLCEKLNYTDGIDREDEFNNTFVMQWIIPERRMLPTLLIIDDDESAVRLYTSYLEDSYNVTATHNAKEAIEHLEENTVHVIVSDIRMPGMDGLSFREYIGRSSANTAPFIFLTSVCDKETITKANNLGIDDFLLKPITKEQLVRAIERISHRSTQITSLLSSRLNHNICNLLQPTLPQESHGWKLRFAHRNTGHGGGDLVFFQQSMDTINITLVDIMGHDEAAKFFAYAYGGYVRGLMQSYTPPLEPGTLLEKLSAVALQDELLSKVILTCCTLSLHRDGNITIACAGHPAPLIIHDSGVDEVDVGGELPGLSQYTKYENTQFKLTDGNRLALYTDGLFESASNNSARLYLENQLCGRMRSSLSSDIDASLQTIMRVFDRLAGTPPNDDSLLILIERDLSRHDS
ncbi:hypothetical protein A9Q99_01650 [Gammaproteobacteria bacterium 45_16_T64]|nr:hypothetical protein A9Q99_01650 [Gammaproteobacteria bacterium 45_16_T64]